MNSKKNKKNQLKHLKIILKNNSFSKQIPKKEKRKKKKKLCFLS